MKSARGFTLIELLVAIMILTLFLAASMGAIRIASRSWEAGHARANATEEMRAVTDFLRRQFAQMPALTWSDGDVEKLMFAGDDKQLRFVAAAPQFSHGAGLLIYTLAARTEDGIDTLTLSYAPFDPGAEEFAAPLESEQLTLATGFDAVSFAYYGAAMQDDRPSWSERWRSDAERYPTLIRLRAHAVDDSWPELEFAVRLGDTL
jgi:general secretion pathway protein J